MNSLNQSNDVLDVFKVLLSALVSPIILLLSLPYLLFSQFASKLANHEVDENLANACCCGAS